MRAILTITYPPVSQITQSNITNDEPAGLFLIGVLSPDSHTNGAARGAVCRAVRFGGKHAVLPCGAILGAIRNGDRVRRLSLRLEPGLSGRLFRCIGHLPAAGRICLHRIRDAGYQPDDTLHPRPHAITVSLFVRW
jgi:hypothetical protein